jgi:hypothetical protein
MSTADLKKLAVDLFYLQILFPVKNALKAVNAGAHFIECYRRIAMPLKGRLVVRTRQIGFRSLY